jgi:hypothetical protein
MRPFSCALMKPRLKHTHSFRKIEANPLRSEFRLVFIRWVPRVPHFMWCRMKPRPLKRLGRIISAVKCGAFYIEKVVYLVGLFEIFCKCGGSTKVIFIFGGFIVFLVGLQNLVAFLVGPLYFWWVRSFVLYLWRATAPSLARRARRNDC